MILNYVFEDIEEYDYDVDVTFQDFFEFIKPLDFKYWREDGRFAYERACRDVWNSSWFKLEDLEEDDEFYDFMREKYEKDAREEWERYYEI